MSKEKGAVATIVSYTNGSYHRNYKLNWHRDVEAGTLLFTDADMERFALSVRKAALARVSQSLPDANKLTSVIRNFGYATFDQSVEMAEAIAALLTASTDAKAVRGDADGWACIRCGAFTDVCPQCAAALKQSEPKPANIPEIMRKLGYTEREIAFAVEQLSAEAGRTKGMNYDKLSE